ncbi:MAG: sterol desaturase family protein [Mariprofundus sp.]|nr:sterol desaturase family protein [Mariprofundus sp.]
MDETSIRVSVFFSVLLIMAVAETVAPRRSLSIGRARWSANLSIVIMDVLIVRLLLPGGAIAAALWADTHGLGLFNWLTWLNSVEIIAAVILLDLVIYGQHVLFHAVPLLWRLHMVHHADRDIDVTTGLRFHPIEIILSMLIKMIVVVLLGAPALAVFIFEIVLNGMAMFNHSNVRLPKNLDYLLRLLIITPDVHRVHHSVIKAETNSNFGFYLSIWDRLFSTYRAQPKLGHTDMTIGLEHLQSAPTYKLGFMLRLPFSGEIGQYPMFKSQEGRHE